MNIELTPRLENAIKSLMTWVPSNLPDEVAIIVDDVLRTYRMKDEWKLECLDSEPAVLVGDQFVKSSLVDWGAMNEDKHEIGKDPVNVFEVARHTPCSQELMDALARVFSPACARSVSLLPAGDVNEYAEAEKLISQIKRDAMMSGKAIASQTPPSASSRQEINTLLERLRKKFPKNVAIDTADREEPTIPENWFERYSSIGHAEKVNLVRELLREIDPSFTEGTDKAVTGIFNYADTRTPNGGLVVAIDEDMIRCIRYTDILETLYLPGSVSEHAQEIGAFLGRYVVGAKQVGPFRHMITDSQSFVVPPEEDHAVGCSSKLMEHSQLDCDDVISYLELYGMTPTKTNGTHTVFRTEGKDFTIMPDQAVCITRAWVESKNKKGI